MNNEIIIPSVEVIDGSTETVEEAIERLACLSRLEYEQVRTKEAKNLQIRVPYLDGVVGDLRRSKEPEIEDNSIIESLEPWEDKVDVKWLIEQIKNQLNAYCALPDNYLYPIIAWILGTYCFNSFRIYPKLCIVSPQKRCGKSTLMEVVDALCFKGVMASNVSAAVIYRIIEAFQPTLLLDEADTWLVGRHVNDDMRGIVNSGHTKTTARVLRSEGDNHEPKAFSTWSPMVIGMIGIPQATIVDRSLMIPMERKTKNEIVHKLSVEYKSTCKDLRSAVLRWANDNEDAIKLIQISPPPLNNDRAMDNWAPLLAIAKQIGEPFKSELEKAYVVINAEETDEEDIAVELLKDIKSIFDELNVDKIHSSILVNKLIGIEGRPWSEWKRGNPMTPNSLSRILSGFKIKPKDIRVGTINRKGYIKQAFMDSFERYI